MPTHYAVRVFYLGDTFFGYQRQPNVETVEGTIIDALIKTGHIYGPKENKFRSASRTDRFVSALGNVFSFISNKKLILGQINSKLMKKNIVCWAYATVPENFSPRYPKFKKYWYILPYDLLLEKNISRHQLEDLLKHFVGTHDFSFFCKRDGRNPHRTIENIKIIDFSNNVLIIEFKAESFLWQQIRRIVGYVLNYNKISPKLPNIRELLECTSFPQELGIKPADPENLILVELYYPKIKWLYSKEAISIALNLLDDKIKRLANKISLSKVLKSYFNENK